MAKPEMISAWKQAAIFVVTAGAAWYAGVVGLIVGGIVSIAAVKFGTALDRRYRAKRLASLNNKTP